MPSVQGPAPILVFYIFTRPRLYASHLTRPPLSCPALTEIGSRRILNVMAGEEEALSSSLTRCVAAVSTRAKLLRGHLKQATHEIDHRLEGVRLNLMHGVVVPEEARSLEALFLSLQAQASRRGPEVQNQQHEVRSDARVAENGDDVELKAAQGAAKIWRFRL